MKGLGCTQQPQATAQSRFSKVRYNHDCTQWSLIFNTNIGGVTRTHTHTKKDISHNTHHSYNRDHLYGGRCLYCGMMTFSLV